MGARTADFRRVVGVHSRIFFGLPFWISLIVLGFGKRGLLEKGSFQKVHFVEILENLEIREILENPPRLWKRKENPTIF